jgi:hypothetical protein
VSIPRSLREHNERVFTEMVQVAFYYLDDPHLRWHPDPNVSGVRIVAGSSVEAQESLPQILVHVGDLSEYKGAIDHLAEWTSELERRVYTDQSFVRITHYAEVEDEAAAMADYTRRALYRARQMGDLGKRSIFGLTSLAASEPAPGIAGTKYDYVYGVIVQAAFMNVSRQSTEASMSDPLWQGAEFEDGDHPDAEPGDSGTIGGGGIDGDTEPAPPPLPEGVLANAGARRVMKVYRPNTREVFVEFDGMIGPYQLSGFTVRVGSEVVDVPVVRDVRHYSRAIAEFTGEIPSRMPVSVSYTPGNLAAASDPLSVGEALTAFGPLDAPYTPR